MLLATQIQAILYHFLMGWVYACGFSFVVTFVKSLYYPFFKAIMEIAYHILFTLLMFYGLYKINGGITNAYLIAFFIFGVFIYYSLYLTVFLQLFYTIKRFLHPFAMKFTIVKKRILDIIKLPNKIRKRRNADAKYKTQKAQKQNQKKSNKNSD